MNTKSPRLSIIVPVYKVEKYLRKCIESILSQTFHDFELILIDDGSPDCCGQICDEYAEIDKRIRVIHQDNAGVSRARNIGMQSACGQWIGFVDSDDYLDPMAYEELLNQADIYECDMAVMDFAYVDESGNVIPGRERKYGGVLPLYNHDIIRMQFDIPLSIRLVMFNKIFKREILSGLFYDETLRCAEDTLLLSQCLERVQKAVFVKKPLYYNVQREGSAMHGALKIGDFEKSLDVHKRIADRIQILYPDIYDVAFAYYIDSCIWKMRTFSKFPVGLNEEERLQYFQSYKRMKKRLRTECKGIVLCHALTWKQKISYLMIGVTG